MTMCSMEFSQIFLLMLFRTLCFYLRLYWLGLQLKFLGLQILWPLTWLSWALSFGIEVLLPPALVQQAVLSDSLFSAVYGFGLPPVCFLYKNKYKKIKNTRKIYKDNAYTTDGLPLSSME